MLHHCHSPRLLPKLCSVLVGDKSAKLRQSAAKYLLQVVQEWQPAAYERQQVELERAILAAARDAQAETRSAGRAMYAAYAHACPGAASALLRRLDNDRALQEKLSQTMQSYVSGEVNSLSRFGSVACVQQVSTCFVLSDCLSRRAGV